MIEKEIILFIRSQQQHDDAPPDDTELMTEGIMTTADDGEITLSYEETELTGMPGVTTRFIIRDDEVTLSRTGAISSQMVFQPGQRHSSMYHTPWGSLQMDITTSALRHRVTERGGLLEICYSILVGRQVISSNRFKIRVQEKTR